MGRNDNTLTYYMWGYQTYYRGASESLAKTIFTALDPRFAPSVFLVGLLDAPRNDRHAVCFEPEDCGMEPADFEGIRDLADEIRIGDFESQIIHTLPEAQRNLDARIAKKSLQRAVKCVVEERFKDDDLVSYVSWPAKVAGFTVFVVLQLQKDVFESHYHLRKETLDERSVVARSYLEATVLEFLEMCRQELSLPEPGSSLLAFHRKSRDVPREAAELFASRVALAADRHGLVGDLFDTFNKISAMYYEKQAGRGSLALVSQDHPDVIVDVRIAEPVRLGNHRAIRKLVEVSSRGTTLLSDGQAVYGLGRIREDYDPAREDLFEILFTEHHGWSVAHDGNVMMRVAHNVPLPLLPRIDQQKLASDMQRIFGLAAAQTRMLVDIVEEATGLGHGAQLVISADAVKEAARLAPQATVVEPVSLTTELVRMMCAVDGAILLDPLGRCHAFGVILDGSVSSKGDRSRGSRYNSAIRYADGKTDCLVIVISDDETIDFVPDLRPQVSRGLIQMAIRELTAIVEEKREEDSDYNPLMGWLSHHRFYLSLEQCQTVNALRRTVEERRVYETGMLYIKYDDLAPHPEMNASYLVD